MLLDRDVGGGGRRRFTPSERGRQDDGRPNDRDARGPNYRPDPTTATVAVDDDGGGRGRQWGRFRRRRRPAVAAATAPRRRVDEFDDGGVGGRPPSLAVVAIVVVTVVYIAAVDPVVFATTTPPSRRIFIRGRRRTAPARGATGHVDVVEVASNNPWRCPPPPPRRRVVLELRGQFPILHTPPLRNERNSPLPTTLLPPLSDSTKR